MRALATRTRDSATEIEEMITGLQGRTSQVSTMMQDSVKRSHTSAEEASGSIVSFKEIVEGANSIVSMTSDVASAVDEQTSVAGLINDNAERIRDIVDMANEQVKENAQASEEVAKQASNLQIIVNQFKVLPDKTMIKKTYCVPPTIISSSFNVGCPTPTGTLCPALPQTPTP